MRQDHLKIAKSRSISKQRRSAAGKHSEGRLVRHQGQIHNLNVQKNRVCVRWIAAIEIHCQWQAIPLNAIHKLREWQVAQSGAHRATLSTASCRFSMVISRSWAPPLSRSQTSSERERERERTGHTPGYILRGTYSRVRSTEYHCTLRLEPSILNQLDSGFWLHILICSSMFVNAAPPFSGANSVFSESESAHRTRILTVHLLGEGAQEESVLLAGCLAEWFGRLCSW